MDESRLVNERISSLSAFCKKHLDKLSWLVLALIIWFSAFIRTRNLPALRDVTTGGWTLGPDLDPFLFLRWSKDIIFSGSLPAIDFMRNVPLGYPTESEFVFLPHLMALFHKLAIMFGSVSIEHSAVLFPVFMFTLTVISFFLFVRKLFVAQTGAYAATLIALVASFFLSVIPALLPRTIAGIPEKESAAFFFMFLAFFFFLHSWSAEKRVPRFVYAILAGIATAGMGLIWGGVIYIFITISLAFLIAFLLKQVQGSKQLIFPVWLVTSLLLVMPFSTRYSLPNLIVSESTSIPIAVCFLIMVNYLLFETRLRDKITTRFAKIPPQFLSLIVTGILLVIGLVIIDGPGAVIGKFTALIDKLINPFTQTRFNITVAENRMPYFNEWAGSFGPHLFNIPITFWLFFIGSIYLFWNMTQVFEKKARRYLTLAYIIFLFALIFSRIRPDGLLNGENFFSNLVYFSGMIILVGTFLYWYFAYFKQSRLDELKSLDFGFLSLFSLFFLSVVSARGGVRLILVLVPPAAILASYLLVNLGRTANSKPQGWKVFTWIAFVIVLLGAFFAGVQFAKASIGTAHGYVPSSYTQQWQKAMAWVRENTAPNAVFGHWWDYGYWVQTMGERATVLDGGNAIVYWNHFMGRYALTGPDEKEALSFLYAHNTTHFLIDSTDIGKYPAFSSIGSNENYDRYSWLNQMLKDPTKTVELKNATRFVYTGGYIFDDDFVYTANGTTIFIPALKGGVAAILLEQTNTGELRQPQAIAVYQNKQYQFPLRYAFFNDTLIDFKKGVDAGIYIFPVFQQEANRVGIDSTGALIYLSNKTVRSQLARLYLYGEETPAFTLVHTQDDPIVEQLKALTILGSDQDFVYFQGIRGPIKIWEINYPKNIALNSTYLETQFRDPRLEEVDR